MPSIAREEQVAVPSFRGRDTDFRRSGNGQVEMASVGGGGGSVQFFRGRVGVAKTPLHGGHGLSTFIYSLRLFKFYYRLVQDNH